MLLYFVWIFLLQLMLLNFDLKSWKLFIFIWSLRTYFLLLSKWRKIWMTLVGWVCLFVYFFEGQNENSHPLVYLSNTHSGQSWAKLKPRNWKFNPEMWLFKLLGPSSSAKVHTIWKPELGVKHGYSDREYGLLRH